MYTKTRCHKKEEVLDRKLRQTPKEMRIDLIRFYITMDQIEKAQEVSELSFCVFFYNCCIADSLVITSLLCRLQILIVIS